MPLPSHAITVTGGCNCTALRYEISIPDLSNRPLHPSSPPTNPVHLPFICTDHCNDCRRATGSILPAWICAPISMISTSLVIRSKTRVQDFSSTPNSSNPSPSIDKEERTPWLPASETFTPGSTSSDSFLTFYYSSEGRRRSFCGRCGTNLSYAALPMPEGWPDMLDVVLGSVDKECLDDESLVPERQLWWDYGVEWVKGLTSDGVGGLPKHPSYKVDEFVGSGRGDVL